MPQTTIDSHNEPKQNNYDIIVKNLGNINDEIYIFRKCIEEMSTEMERMKNVQFDWTMLLGILQAEIRVWVGVAEE